MWSCHHHASYKVRHCREFTKNICEPVSKLCHSFKPTRKCMRSMVLLCSIEEILKEILDFSETLIL